MKVKSNKKEGNKSEVKTTEEIFEEIVNNLRNHSFSKDQLSTIQELCESKVQEIVEESTKNCLEDVIREYIEKFNETIDEENSEDEENDDNAKKSKKKLTRQKKREKNYFHDLEITEASGTREYSDSQVHPTESVTTIVLQFGVKYHDKTVVYTRTSISTSYGNDGREEYDRDGPKWELEDLDYFIEFINSCFDAIASHLSLSVRDSDCDLS